MQCFALRLASVLIVSIVQACAEGTQEADGGNPLQKVMKLMVKLQAEVIADGERAQKIYNEKVKWCSNSAKQLQDQIQQGQAKKEDLEANIAKSTSDNAEAKTRIAALSGSMATDEADLKVARLLREKEHEDFKLFDAELVSTIGTLQKAIKVLKQELEKAKLSGKTSFLQRPTNGMLTFTTALTELVTAATVFSGEDRAILTDLLQRAQQGDGVGAAAEIGSDDDADEPGAPAAVVYEHHSGGVLDTLAELKSKADAAQAQMRQGEVNRRMNFDKLRQSLEGKVKLQSKELDGARQDMARADERKAKAQKELSTCASSLQENLKTLESLQRECMESAKQYTEEVDERTAELDALAKAKRAIQETSGGQAYSFVQVSAQAVHASSDVQASSARVLAATNAVKTLRALAKRTGSLALTQLSSRASAELRYAFAGTSHLGSKDPFAKVKGMIQAMISKLENEGKADVAQKTFCDREMSRTVKSKQEKEGDLSDLSAQLDVVTAKVASLQEEANTFTKELAEIATSQADMDKIRNQEHEAFLEAKKELEEGLSGVQTALSVLRDYFGGDDGAGASMVQEDDVADSMAQLSAGGVQQRAVGSGVGGGAAAIMGMLEVVASDFAKSLTEMQTIENSAAADYKQLTQDHKVGSATRKAQVENNNAEIARLRKSAAEMTADRAQSQQELEAINEYWEKLKPQCVVQPENYNQKVQKRQAELDGLMQALDALGAGSS